MSRLIKDSELIMAIANWQQTLMPGWSSPDDADSIIYETLEEVCKLIESQPPADNWIPCSVAIPKPFINVLITYDDGGVDCLHLEYDNKWHDNGWLVFEHPEIVAWMPLPEPYKGVE